MQDKSFVIYIDIKDFTYKNTLLTDSQVEEILKEFDSIVTSAAKQYSISLIKSIGDAYLAISTDAKNTYEYTKLVLDKSQEYDQTQKIDIKKISLRACVTHGNITKNNTLKLDDYFGDPINLSSRMMGITPRGMIFADAPAAKLLSKIKKSKKVHTTLFHGMIADTQIYALTDMSPEDINNLSKPNDNKLERCDDIVFKASCVAAILSVQPIPFIEGVNIIGVHLYMIVKLSQVLEMQVTLRKSSKIFTDIAAPLSLSYVSMLGASTAMKILLPGVGGLLFAPMSFAMTYALGKIYTSYFYYEKAEESFIPHMLKPMFQRQKMLGKQIAKTRKKEILMVGKSSYKEILSIKKKQNFSEIQKETLGMLKKK